MRATATSRRRCAPPAPPVRGCEALLGRVQRARRRRGVRRRARRRCSCPARRSGPGPLQRRAEITELRERLEQAARRARRAPQAAAEARARGAGRGRSRPQHHGRARPARARSRRCAAPTRRVREVERRVERVTREVQQSDRARRTPDGARARNCRRGPAQLGEQLDALETQAGEADSAIAEARGVLAETEQALEEAREARARWQVTQAQAQARAVGGAGPRASPQRGGCDGRGTPHRTRGGAEHAGQRRPGSWPSSWRTWQVELETQRKSLTDAEARLDGGRGAGARHRRAALDAAERALDEARRAADASVGEALHHAELRTPSCPGGARRSAQRLETEWRRPLEELLAGGRGARGRDRGAARRGRASCATQLDAARRR